ncbi:hypothetical protein [Modestobacter sp. DSM 44400]|uniref:hypothetical protein n=1 Tax=Modestobacter sp. DSM 44400 TaxID=1550230 RepID=UPI0015877543|nr:hypothetical protein [Modestobacter sp. DSM 44400]
MPRTVLGAPVTVDAEMAPLLDALAAAGVVTVGSCVNLSEATARLWPAKLPALTAGVQPAVNYRRTLVEGLAFVRLLDTEAAAPFPSAVERLGGEVLRSGPLAQVAFPRWQMSALVAQL